ncbi:MAG: pyridoxamine 5'-phosphate oxidase family protein [Ferrimonas sp.]
MQPTINLSDRLLPEIDAFKQNQQTLLLASTDKTHKSNVSYAPYAIENNHFYILISDIAKHGKNIKHNKQLSVMIIEDEHHTNNIYARKRLTFDVKAELVSRTSAEFIIGCDALISRFGDIAIHLRDLADFNLYRLRPYQGLFVKGFGQAFTITGSDLTTVEWAQGDGKGHQRQEAQ